MAQGICGPAPLAPRSMGWLKPEVDLIDPEFRGDWAHLRAQPGDPPAGPVNVTARGERVWGLRLDGDSVTEEELVLDGGFDVCAVPEMMGLPIMAKRLHGEEAREEPCAATRAFLLTQVRARVRVRRDPPIGRRCTVAVGHTPTLTLTFPADPAHDSAGARPSSGVEQGGA